MDPIFRDITVLISHILNPATFAFILSLGGSVAYLIKDFKKRMDDMRNASLKTLQERMDKLDLLTDQRLDDVEKEILRLQILEGIHSNRLTPSEISYFYDRYKELGGNSFVTAKVKKYISDYEKENGE